jgi:hypothetical protein
MTLEVIIFFYCHKKLLIYFDNYLVEDDDKEVSMGAGEDRNVHGYGGGVGLVQPHAKVTFTAQQQQDKHACDKLKYTVFIFQHRCALYVQNRVHRVATAAFWRTFHHEGKISPGWWGCGVHAHPLSLHLPSPVKLQCTVQLSGQTPKSIKRKNGKYCTSSL